MAALIKRRPLKQTIIDALAGLVKEKRCRVFGFVIMPNYIHLLWKMGDGYARAQVQGALLCFTAHGFKLGLKEMDKSRLQPHFVGDSDRNYRFWERDSGVKGRWSETFLLQKLNYIHNNPCQPHWNLASVPEEYYWSSAAFYFSGHAAFPWLSHYAG